MKRIIKRMTVIVLALLMIQGSVPLSTFAADGDPVLSMSVANKIDVALAVGPTTVNYATFEADLRRALKYESDGITLREHPVPDEDVYIMATKAVNASTQAEFTWWTYDHTFYDQTLRPVRTDRDGAGLSSNKQFSTDTGYNSYEKYYQYLKAQALLGASKTWTSATAPAVAELAEYIDYAYPYQISDTSRIYIEKDRSTAAQTSSGAAANNQDKTSPDYNTTRHPYQGNVYHMKESNNGATMDFYGYGQYSFKDFRYLPNDQKTVKTFEFAIAEDIAYDALDGVGFFFNMNITESPTAYTGTGTNQQLMSGYLLFLAYNNATNTTIQGKGRKMSLYKFENINVQDFHNQLATTTTNGGTIDTAYFATNFKDRNGRAFVEIASAAYSQTDMSRRIKIEAGPDKVQVWYVGTATKNHAPTLTTPISESVLPVNWTVQAGGALPAQGQTSGSVRTNILLDSNVVKSYGFGPMASYIGHGCARPTHIALQNLSMTVEVVKTLTEVVREPEWHENTLKYLVNLNENTIEDFNPENNVVIADLLTRMGNDDIYYIGWGSTKNAVASAEFLRKNNLKGIIVDINKQTDLHSSEEWNSLPQAEKAFYEDCITHATAYNEQICAIADEIYKRYWNQADEDRALTTDTVKMQVTGADMQNTEDALWPGGKWMIKHIVDAGSIAVDSDNSIYMTNFEGQYQNSGIYMPDLDLEYSFTLPGLYQIYYRNTVIGELIVHRAPEADFTVTYDIDGFITSYESLAYDPDVFDPGGINGVKRGIRDENWSWMNVTAGMSEFEGGMPTKLVDGDLYNIMLTVTDDWGAERSVMKQFVYSAQSTVKVPPFANFTLSPITFMKTTDLEAQQAQQVTLTNKSYDPAGLPIVSTWEVKKDGVSYPGLTITDADFTGSVAKISVGQLPEGHYTITLTVSNGVLNTADGPVTLYFDIVVDNINPSAKIALNSAPAPGPEVFSGNQSLTLTFSDDGGSGFKEGRFAVTDNAALPQGGDTAWKTTAVSISRGVLINAVGVNYVHWEAWDNAGNYASGTFGPYTLNKKDLTMSLSTEPQAGTTVLYGVSGKGITLTAILTVEEEDALPTGTVIFYQGVTPIGSAAVDRDGIATWTGATIAAEVPASFAANYTGDSNYKTHQATAIRNVLGASALTQYSVSYDLKAPLGEVTGIIPTDTNHYLDKDEAYEQLEIGTIEGITAMRVKSGSGMLRNGYTFVGWAEEPNAEDPIYVGGELIFYTFKTDITLYAIWKHNTYTITYTDGGADPETGEVPQGENVLFGAPVTVQEAPVGLKKVGYRFMGWLDEISGRTYLIGETFDMPDADMTLKAIWIETGDFELHKLLKGEFADWGITSGSEFRVRVYDEAGELGHRNLMLFLEQKNGSPGSGGYTSTYTAIGYNDGDKDVFFGYEQGTRPTVSGSDAIVNELKISKNAPAVVLGLPTETTASYIVEELDASANFIEVSWTYLQGASYHTENGNTEFAIVVVHDGPATVTTINDYLWGHSLVKIQKYFPGNADVDEAAGDEWYDIFSFYETWGITFDTPFYAKIQRWEPSDSQKSVKDIVLGENGLPDEEIEDGAWKTLKFIESFVPGQYGDATGIPCFEYIDSGNITYVPFSVNNPALLIDMTETAYHRVTEFWGEERVSGGEHHKYCINNTEDHLLCIVPIGLVRTTPATAPYMPVSWVSVDVDYSQHKPDEEGDSGRVGNFSISVRNTFRPGVAEYHVTKELADPVPDWWEDASESFIIQVYDETDGNMLLWDVGDATTDESGNTVYRCVGNAIGGLSDPMDEQGRSGVDFSLTIERGETIVLNNMWTNHIYRVMEIPANDGRYSTAITIDGEEKASMLVEPGRSYDVLVRNTYAPYYKVTYQDGVFGEPTPDDLAYYKAEDLALLQEPIVSEHAGYGFDGWDTRADGKGTRYEPGDEITVADHLTLYAQWVPNWYPVSYFAGNGTDEFYSNGTFTVEHSDILVLSNDTTAFAKYGYQFFGWGTTDLAYPNDAACFAPGDVFDMPVGGVTFTALWERDYSGSLTVHKILDTLDFEDFDYDTVFYFRVRDITSVYSMFDPIYFIQTDAEENTWHYAGYDEVEGATANIPFTHNQPAKLINLPVGNLFEVEEVWSSGTFNCFPEYGYSPFNRFEEFGYLFGAETPPVMPAGGNLEVAVTNYLEEALTQGFGFRVYYDPGGAIGQAPEDEGLYDGDPESIMPPELKSPSEFPADLAKEGYTFIGWKSDYEGEEDLYQPGALYAMHGCDVTFTALWKLSDDGGSLPKQPPEGPAENYPPATQNGLPGPATPNGIPEETPSGLPDGPSQPQSEPYNPIEGRPAVPPELAKPVEAYERLFSRRFIQGFPDGTFQAERQMTRAEMMQVFFNISSPSSLVTDALTSTSFSDVQTDAWYFTAVAYLEQRNVITGYDGMLNPNEPITNAEFAAMAVRYFRLEGILEPQAMLSAEDHWAANYVNIGFTSGWFKYFEMEEGFDPDSPILRAQAVALLNFYQGRTPCVTGISRHLEKTDTRVFSDMYQGHWSFYEVMEAAYSKHFYFDSGGTQVWETVL